MPDSFAVAMNRLGQSRLRYVDPVISPRAGGMSVRVNLNPDGACNFHCPYCYVDRERLQLESSCLNVNSAMNELREVLALIRTGQATSLPGMKDAPPEFLNLGHVALSGDGEPTLSPFFEEVIDRLIHFRAQGESGFFRITLITNASQLNEPAVRRGLKLLAASDEIWAKLDVGSAEAFQGVNRSDVSYEHVLDGLQSVGKDHPLIIQSMFPRWKGRFLPPSEQRAYVERLHWLIGRGVPIQKVQIYSVMRPAMDPDATHAALSELSGLATQVAESVQVPVQVY